MKRNGYRNLIIIALALTFGLTACASSGGSGTGGTRGNLNRLKVNKEAELRQSWKDYTVYKRGRDRSFRPGFVAFVYKIKNDKKIILDSRWVEVTSDEMKAKAKIFSGTISAEILGHNQELYGYLIYRRDDVVSVRIVDEQTVQLNYRYNRTYSQ
jgi:hypothetical protein